MNQILGQLNLLSLDDITTYLDNISNDFKHRTQAQLQSHRLKYEKSLNPRTDESTIIEIILKEFEQQWGNLIERLKMVQKLAFFMPF